MERTRVGSLAAVALVGMALVGMALLLAACQSAPPPPPPPPPTPAVVDLEGLWLVTPAPGTTYGAGGTTTLEIGSEPTGVANFLSRSDVTGITACERHVYSALSLDVVMLDGAFYVADVVDPDRMVLSNESAELTLDRVAGPRPVQPCDVVKAGLVATFDVGTAAFSRLNAVGTNLLFNSDDAGEPIVAYDTVTDLLGAPRTYSAVTLTGVHRYVVGARTDDLLYGHCGCGGSPTLDRFDLGANASLAAIDTVADLGVGITIRYGYFDGGIVIGGRRKDDVSVNELLTLHPDTLALVAQRQILYDTFVQDITLHQGALLALVGERILVVGADGKAQRTIEIDGLDGVVAQGLAALGTNAYVLAQTADGEAVLFEVAIP
jgi:hypothetical protein